ncbi:hypothetical protein L083_1514 [Actinoplanes sp. N902-109]|nr:hypothetical protein L083_1514 [Actinoplanes sp. N902-109]
MESPAGGELPAEAGAAAETGLDGNAEQTQLDGNAERTQLREGAGETRSGGSVDGTRVDGGAGQEAAAATEEAPQRWTGSAAVPPHVPKKPRWSRRRPDEPEPSPPADPWAESEDWSAIPAVDPWADHDTPIDPLGPYYEEPFPEALPPTRIDGPGGRAGAGSLPPTRHDAAGPLPPTRLEGAGPVPPARQDGPGSLSPTGQDGAGPLPPTRVDQQSAGAGPGRPPAGPLPPAWKPPNGAGSGWPSPPSPPATAAAGSPSAGGGSVPPSASGGSVPPPASWSGRAAAPTSAGSRAPAGQSPVPQNPAGQRPVPQSPAAQRPAAQDPAAPSRATRSPAAQPPAAQPPAAQPPAAPPTRKEERAAKREQARQAKDEQARNAKDRGRNNQIVTPPPNRLPVQPRSQRPASPPPRTKPKRRRWGRRLFLFTLLSALCCCGIPGYFLSPYAEQYPVSAVLPSTIGDLNLRDGTDKPDLGQDMQGTVVLGGEPFAGVYTDGNGKRVTIFGRTGFRLTPQADVEAELNHLTDQYGIHDIQSYDAGVSGVHERCGVGQSAEDSLVVCAWADRGSLATVLFTRRSAQESAQLTGELRTAVLNPRFTTDLTRVI